MRRSRRFIKICGIKDQAGAMAAAAAGADAIGFVFDPASRRLVTPEQAALLGPGREIERVGVFVNSRLDELVQVASMARLTMIQLHGEEDPGFCREVTRLTGCRAIKAIRVRSSDDIKTLSDFDVEYIVLDSFHAGTAGGSGRAFDWRILPKQPSFRDRLLMAGGLEPNNVTDVLDLIGPAGVDVSTGVESNGSKDPLKIAAFVKAIRQWETRQ